MLLASFVGAAILVNVAASPTLEPNGSALHLSLQQKNAAVQPLVRAATECIAGRVAADPRFRRNKADNLGDLIVESIPACIGPVRALIDTYDRYFGDGSGEAFFMGPYLDVLPTAVSKWGKREVD
jgi:hypothetical protein